MKTTLSPALWAEIEGALRGADAIAESEGSRAVGERQPVHTVYGGAHLFRADLAAKLGTTALAALDEHAPDAPTFAEAFGLVATGSITTSPEARAAFESALRDDPAGVRAALPGVWLAHTVRARVVDKLRSEPVEDLRVDFEDGFGVRPDAEEDAAAIRVAGETARGMRERSLPARFGVRIKSLSRETRARALRTLDLYLTALAAETGGALPSGFVVTLPKVTAPAHVEVLVAALEALETGLAFAPGSLRLELMVETTEALFDAEGRLALPALVRAARGRCSAAHFGTYDYTASVDVTAAFQAMRHPAASFARHVMQVSLARTGVRISDGATNVMPVGIHRKPEGALSAEERAENRARVHAAWRLQVADVRDSLVRGIYQGWDLHPAQICARYAAVYAFFLEGLDAAAERLASFVAKAAQASLTGSVFDDAATGQGLLNYFLRALAAGALREDEVVARTGLTKEELALRSFAAILAQRGR
jgi:hypothetical protein